MMKTHFNDENSFLKKKKFGQNFEFSAHSGGCNLVKITFYLVLSHCGSNPNIKFVKNLLKSKFSC